MRFRSPLLTLTLLLVSAPFVGAQVSITQMQPHEGPFLKFDNFQLPNAQFNFTVADGRRVMEGGNPFTLVVAGNSEDNTKGTKTGAAYCCLAREGDASNVTWKELKQPANEVMFDGGYGEEVLCLGVDTTNKTAEIGVSARRTPTAGGAFYVWKYNYIDPSRAPILTQKIVASDTDPQDHFGHFCQLSGDEKRLFIAATNAAVPDPRTGMPLPRGKVYCLEKNAMDLWAEIAQIFNGSLAPGAAMGTGLSCSHTGDVVGTGNPGDQQPGEMPGSGSVSIWEFVDGLFQEVVTTVPSGRTPFSAYGTSVCGVERTTCSSSSCKQYTLFCSSPPANECFALQHCSGGSGCGTLHKKFRTGRLTQGGNAMLGKAMVCQKRSNGKFRVAASAPLGNNGNGTVFLWDTTLSTVDRDDPGEIDEARGQPGAVWGNALKLLNGANQLLVSSPVVGSGSGQGKLVNISLDGTFKGDPIFDSYANACGTGMGAPRYACSGGAEPGDTLQVHIKGGAPNSVGAFILGIGRASVPLPAGCNFPLGTVAITLTFPLDSRGEAKFLVTVPPATPAGFKATSALVSIKSPTQYGITNPIEWKLNFK